MKRSLGSFVKRLVVLLAFGTGVAPPLAAQSTPVLDSVERAADLGQADEARRMIPSLTHDRDFVLEGPTPAKQAAVGS